MKATVVTLILVGILAVFAGVKLSDDKNDFNTGNFLFSILLIAGGVFAEIVAAFLFLYLVLSRS